MARKMDWLACHRRTEDLRSKLQREVRPADVVKDAENPKSPFNRYFEWNDSKAGHRFRIQQARALLQHLKVIYTDNEGNEVSVRKYVRVTLSAPADHHIRSGYAPRIKVLKTAYLRGQVVETALQMLESFKRRFRMFAEIEATYPHIEAAIEMLSGAKQRKKRKAL